MPQTHRKPASAQKLGMGAPRSLTAARMAVAALHPLRGPLLASLQTARLLQPSQAHAGSGGVRRAWSLQRQAPCCYRRRLPAVVLPSAPVPRAPPFLRQPCVPWPPAALLSPHRNWLWQPAVRPPALATCHTDVDSEPTPALPLLLVLTSLTTRGRAPTRAPAGRRAKPAHLAAVPTLQPAPAGQQTVPAALHHAPRKRTAAHAATTLRCSRSGPPALPLRAQPQRTPAGRCWLPAPSRPAHGRPGAARSPAPPPASRHARALPPRPSGR